MFKGKTALITGSTSGIGQGIAEAFAMRACNVVLNGFGDLEKSRNCARKSPRDMACRFALTAPT
jgi:3-hydroxybutyrate dehydrogenase